METEGMYALVNDARSIQNKTKTKYARAYKKGASG